MNFLSWVGDAGSRQIMMGVVLNWFSELGVNCSEAEGRYSTTIYRDVLRFPNSTVEWRDRYSKNVCAGAGKRRPKGAKL